ncbi:glycoside hydrolase family 114 protein [Marasmius fiardii PR-910]|nr:glycoside hydrolase family 114 protein [Marasmius fiardii PR-910]
MISSILVLFAISLASTNAAVTKRAITPLPVNGKFDYQIGGAYTPSADVQVVTRDRNDSPAQGKYNICYVNAFQTQPDEKAFWMSPGRDHLILRKANGNYFADPNWPGEYLLNTTTNQNRQEIATIVNGWILGCQQKGFNGIEPDNLDTYSRSNKLITLDNNLQLAKLLADYAHSLNLAFGQKNAAEASTKAKSVAGFDFAIAEQCQQYNECNSYTNVYGNQLLEIEYYDDSLPQNGLVNFQQACAARGSQISIIYRDVDVSPPGADYVYQEC